MIQSYGLPQPVKVIAGDLPALAAKVRSALMTDGNTKFRPAIRATLTYLLLHGPAFGLDITLFLQAAVRLAVPEVLAAIGNAQIGKMAAAETGDAA